MESAESAEMTTELDLSIDRHLQDFMPPSMKDSDSSSSSLSTSDIFSDKSCGEQYEKDILEGILYRTTQDEVKTTMRFMSNAFFHLLLSKMKADIACSIEIDNTSFIFKYMTHVKCVKCQVILDCHFCNITVTDVGHRLWREYYFSKAAHSIFKRHLQDTDKRDTEPLEFRSLSSGEESSIESSGMTSSEESSTGSSSMTGSEGSRTESSSISFTEDSRIFPSENSIQPIHISTPNAKSSGSNVYTGESRQECDLYRAQSNDDYGIMNQQRGESDGRQLSFLVAKIGKMESEIQELRRTVISLMQAMIPTPTYSEAVNRKKALQLLHSHSHR